MYSPMAPGFYTVCLQVANAFSADNKCKIVEIKAVGTYDPKTSTPVVFFPNPTSGAISWQGAENQKVRLRVFNTLGQMITQINPDSNQADLSNLSTGIYYIQLIDSQNLNTLGSQKLIIITP